MKHGFLKIALSAPRMRVADPEYNVDACIEAARRAREDGAGVILFPELALTGATAGDLYFSASLIRAAEDALARYLRETADLDILSFIGLPMEIRSTLYDAVAAVCHGEIVSVSFADGISAKKGRYFASGADLLSCTDSILVDVAGAGVFVGGPVIYEIPCVNARIYVEVGADADTAIFEARDGGANLILNPFATPDRLGAHRRLVDGTAALSDRLSVAYIRCGQGMGESGTDGVYTAPRVAASLGETLLDAPLFGEGNAYVTVDVEAINQINKRVAPRRPVSRDFVRPKIDLTPTVCDTPRVKAAPFDYGEEGCEMALLMQAHALANRMERAYASCAVLGISGGLDSTLAVLAAVRAADLAGRARSSVKAVTMPCFGTSRRTKSNALLLCQELGCAVRTIDIKAAVERHFKDIAHDRDNYNVVYENAQARERTQILMDIANAEGGIVVGTGDLSELALGFATYNGDHMSMYGVNASIPKSLMRAIIRHEADRYSREGREKLARVLIDIVETPVSPELLPISGEENAQYTEQIVGPYELHDFFLYYFVKFGFTKEKIGRLCLAAFEGRYTEEEIAKYLDIFFRRFISQQFKRSCLPDGPRVTEISLSPRGAWQMPSDATGTLWKK